MDDSIMSMLTIVAAILVVGGIMVVVVAKVSSSRAQTAFCIVTRRQEMFANVVRTLDSKDIKYSSRGGSMSQVSLDQLGVNRSRAFELWIQIPEKEKVKALLTESFEVEETRFAYIVTEKKRQQA